MPAIDLQKISKLTIEALNAGDRTRAFDLACHAYNDPRAGHLQHLLFGQSMSGLSLQNVEPITRKALLSFMESDRVAHAHMTSVWMSALSVDPALKVIGAAAQKKMFYAEDWKTVEGALHDPMIVEGLRKILITHPTLERFFCNTRKYILLELWPKGLLKTKNIPFLCALAEQCFYNEYVYAVTGEEEAALQILPKDDPVSVAILGCYAPLSNYTISPKLSAVKGFRQMMETQVEAPAREKSLREEIKTFGAIQDGVSKNVQAMYEENPYPRWTSIDISPAPATDITGDILIAGCGTGRMAVHMGASLPDANITAIDLSRSSLAYAMRKAEEYDIGNLDFYQGDIMDLPALGKSFDFIECSGVLHHMKDPAAGWKKLIDILNPGGVMHISLYSTKARADVEKIRNHIKEKGYKPTPADIHRLRKDVMDDENGPLKDILHSRDFYSMSELRDLAFHVQETTYTMIEMKRIFEGLDLELIRLRVPPSIAQDYKEKFPDDPDMADFENWNRFEDEFPATFAGMYKMICRQKGEDVHNNAAVSVLNSLYSG